jgi:hypothetical protein
MIKTKLKPILSVDTYDIIFFITENSNFVWNEACDVFTKELNHIQYNLPDQIEMEDEYRISKVIVSKLEFDGWIKSFTEVQELTEDYYILFTN